MVDKSERVVALHDALIEQYASAYEPNRAEIEAYTDALREYTSAVVLAASQAMAEMLGLDADVSVLQLTDEQYRKLEASDMLDIYIDGKDGTDD